MMYFGEQRMSLEHSSSSDPNREYGGRHARRASISRRTLLQTTGSLAGAGLVGLGATGGVAGQSGVRIPEDSAYIENPQALAENQLVTTAPLIPYADVGTARSLVLNDAPRTENWTESTNFRSLDGEWKFHWALNPNLAPETPAAADASDWNDIRVPSSWQTQGFGHPQYRNIAQSFRPYAPPTVPDAVNPVGSYKRSFSVPDGWGDRRVVLRFDGVKAAFFVWINGDYVGYDQGAMTPAEFDVTDHLTADENTISVKVFRWSDGSYLECQDMWRFAGIYRSVSLYTTPDVHIRDADVRGDLGADYQDGQLAVDAEVADYQGTGTSGYAVRARLYDPDGRAVETLEGSVGPATPAGGATAADPEAVAMDTPAPGSADADATPTATVSLSTTLPSVERWSAEHPNLYGLVLELVGPDGSTAEVLAETVGFRSIEVQSSQVLINGEPVTFRGVNYHDHDPDLGRTVPAERYREDFELMKRFNLNAVRFSHYPHGLAAYDLCDRIGLYLCDEVNAETHQNETISSYPGFQRSFLDRFQRMIQRNKNFPSLFLWSTGNEAGLGSAHVAMAAYARAVDPTRLLYHQPNIPDGTAPYADVVGPRYPSPSGVEDDANQPEEDRPIVLGEFAHAMGNSLGHYQRFYDVIESYDQLQGGFVWDWVDQGLRRPRVTTPDRSDAANEATVRGNPLVTDGLDGGNALSLSGLDDYVELPLDESLDVTGNRLTVEAWVNPRGVNAPDVDFYNLFQHPNAVVFGQMTDPFVVKGGQYGLHERAEGSLEFFINDGGRVGVQAPVPDGWREGWHHIAGVYDGSELKLFVDGELIESNPHSGSIDHVHDPVNVGRDASFQREQFAAWTSQSAYDQVRIYDYDRDIASIDVQADRTAPPEGANLYLDLSEFNERDTFLSYGVSPFCLNGVVSTDRGIQPETHEFGKVHEPVDVIPLDAADGRVRVTNKTDFTNLSAFDVAWTLTADHEPLQRGRLSPAVPPGESAEIVVPFEQPDPGAGTEYHLTIEFRRTEDRPWADAGSLKAWEQFEVPLDTPSVEPTDPDQMSAVELTERGDRVRLSGETFDYEFSRSEGRFTTLRYLGRDLLHEGGGPRLNVWRTPILNETVNWGAAEAEEWRETGLNRLDHQVDRLSVKRLSPSVVEVMVIGFASGPSTPAGFTTEYRYRVLGNGEVIVAHRVEPDDDLGVSHWLPKVGLQLEVPDHYNQLRWHGLGPHETYVDRQTGARVGIYEQDAAETGSSYLVPQDDGNKTGVRWAEVTDVDGYGLAVAGRSLLDISVEPRANPDRTVHRYQTEDRDGLQINVDHAVTGVGGTPVGARPDNRVDPTKNYEYLVRFRPVGPDEPRPTTGTADIEFETAMLSVVGTRTDDGSVFTGGQTDRIDVSVTPSDDVLVRDALPASWNVYTSEGDVARVETDGSTTYVYLEGTAEAESTTEYTYFVEAPTGPTATGRYTFGPVEAQEVTGDGTWTVISGTTDENVVIGVDTGP
jgi:beta-galactosidase